jgi:hypothetical protein
VRYLFNLSYNLKLKIQNKKNSTTQPTHPWSNQTEPVGRPTTVRGAPRDGIPQTGLKEVGPFVWKPFLATFLSRGSWPPHSD